MDEKQVQKKRRENEQQATASRAQILGLSYLDTRNFENEAPLIFDVISKEEMHKNYILPLKIGSGEEPFEFMVTSQTPRSVIDKYRKEYLNKGEHIYFHLISLSAYKVFMLRYDPPREILYDDIKIAGEGDSETIASVSKTLDEVSTEKVFDFLIEFLLFSFLPFKIFVLDLDLYNVFGICFGVLNLI